MADRVVAKGGEAKFTPHPTGQFVARCVDVIDLGLKVEDFPGSDKKLMHKCVLVFRTGEVNPDGHCIDVTGEYTVSMNEKAKLRGILESWRGQSYNDAEASDGVPLDKLENRTALLGVGHKTSGKGRTYSVLLSVVGVPKKMEVPAFPEYTRAEFWGERKNEYRKAVALYRAEIGVDDDGNPISKRGRMVFQDTGAPNHTDADYAPPDDSPNEDDDLPF